MEIFTRTIEWQVISGTGEMEIAKGRGYFDKLHFYDLPERGVFIVEWEDSAHHYSHMRYFDNFEEASNLYADYRKNGIPSIYKEDD